MAKETAKSEEARVHEEELDLSDPLLAEDTEEADRVAREKNIARLRLLWEHRSFLGRSAGVGLVLALLLALLVPSEYTSTARLMPPDQGSGGGLAMLASMAGKAGGGALGSLGGELLGLKTTGDLFAGILGSRTVEDDLISKFDLRNVYGYKRWEDTRKKLTSRTDIAVDRKTEIISISVTDHSPQRAQAMAREYVDALNGVVTSQNTGSAHRERVFLDGRIAEVKQDLEAAEKQFSQFASKNTTLDIESQAKAMLTAGAALQGQLMATETELEGMRQMYTANNVRVREAQAREDYLRGQLQKLGGKPGGTSPPTGGDSTSLYPPIRELPLLGVGYADLYRRTKVEEAIFETLTQEDEVAKVEEAKETPSVKLLDAPEIPERKSSPHRLLITLAGTVLAGIFGAAWVLGGARWQEADPNDSGKVLAQEVFHALRSHLPWQSRNGAVPNAENLRASEKKEKAGAGEVERPEADRGVK